MAGERALPGLGLKAFWTLGSNGWKPDLDQDLLTLSVAVQGRSLAFIASLPGSPSNGDIYIMTSGAETNYVAVRDNGAWVYLIPQSGWVFWNVADSKHYAFNGSTWAVTVAATAWGTITGSLSSQTDLNSALSAKAPLASPALTGNPTAPTQTAGDNSTKLATTAFVTAAVAAGGGGGGGSAVMTLTSTDSIAIASSGSKTLTYGTVTGLGLATGMRVRFAKDASNYMEGVISAVSSTSMTITVDNSAGSGTYNAWTIGVAGDKGASGAAGGWFLQFHPYDNEPPATNYATFGLRNDQPVLAFDTTTQETAVFSAVMPHSYTGGNIVVVLHWAADTATSGTIGWDVTIERIGTSQDMDTNGFATPKVVTAATVNATAGIPSTSTVTLTAGATDTDSVAANEKFRIRIRRDVANDNAAGDAHLIAVTMRE